MKLWSFKSVLSLALGTFAAAAPSSGWAGPPLQWNDIPKFESVELDDLQVDHQIRIRIRSRDLHPTQLGVGMKEVDEIYSDLVRMSPARFDEFRFRRPATVVIGPGGSLWLVDGHHQTLAQYRLGAERVLAKVIANYSGLARPDFEARMKEKKWVRLKDEGGKPVEFGRLWDAKVPELQDDPYRSLARELRKLGAFQKRKIPFMEFEWADLLREEIPLHVLESDWKEAIRQGFEVIRKTRARLPGRYFGRSKECWFRLIREAVGKKP